jgi:solute carrier family 1 (high affinity glutamate transporter) protein 2
MNELIMKIVALIMWYSPFGILCLVAGNIIKIENMAETAQRLSIYMITVIIGLIIHALFTVQMLYFLTTRKNPFKFLKGMLQAWLTAIGTASRYIKGTYL